MIIFKARVAYKPADQPHSDWKPRRVSDCALAKTPQDWILRRRPGHHLHRNLNFRNTEFPKSRLTRRRPYPRSES